MRGRGWELLFRQSCPSGPHFQTFHVPLEICMCIMSSAEKEKNHCRCIASLQSKIAAFRRKEKKEKKLDCFPPRGHGEQE